MRALTLICLFGWLVASHVARADECRPLIVIQISEAALNRSIEKPVERHSVVNELILETHVVGTARTVGTSHVTIVENDRGSTFKIEFTGTTTAQTQGRHSPIVVHSHSQTDFKAEKAVTLEQLGQVLAQPTTVQARTRTTIDSITTHRRGPLGRLILRRAEKEVAARQPAATAIGQRNAEARIVAAFDAALVERLKKLEQQVAMRNFVATVLPSDITPTYRSCTKNGYLTMSVFGKAPETKTVSVNLPALPFDEQPIHVWIHQSVIGKNIDSALGGLGALRHFMPTLIAIPPVIPRFKGPQWTMVEDWFVIQLSGLDA